MIGEEPGVEVVVEVDEEFEISLAHFDALAFAREALVALSAASLAQVDAFWRDLQRLSGGLCHRFEPGKRLGLLARVFGDDDVTLVPIDRRADLGDVAVVDAKRADPAFLEARVQLAEVLAHPVGEHLRLHRQVHRPAAQRSR